MNQSYHMSDADRAIEPILEAREADWRCGAIVYQVFVDRYAPAADLDAKRVLYKSPRVLKKWSDQPQRGKKVKKYGVWSHEIEFWGGDLESLRSKLDHIQELGVGVVYLNPIHEAWTNHKYDALDWFGVSPEYGTRDDVIALASDLESRGMKLMLDGVFNHMGLRSPIFQEALDDPKSEYRKWFDIDEQYQHGYRAWYNAPNLPEVRMEAPSLQARLWGDADSVVQGYLRDGVDGWRLDVAYDYGLKLLSDLTEAAHEAKAGSWIVGEVWNYPEQWCGAMDGVMNMYARRLIIEYINGKIEGGRLGRMFEHMIEDATLECMLRSWLVLDNHDTPRLKTMFPREADRRMAQALQFTLPGAPVIYYGVEAGMTGEQDPTMRGPMDWEAIEQGNPEMDRLLELMEMRRSQRALRIGEFRLLESEKLLAFQRRTNKAMETVTVVANASGLAVTELISLRDPKFMNAMPLRDVLSGEAIYAHTGTIEVTVPARSVMVFVPTDEGEGEYSPYKRMY